MPGESRRIVVLLVATSIGLTGLLPASGGAAALKTSRGTVLLSARYDKAGAFEGERDYFTYTAKAVFDGKGTRITKRGTMTWSFDAGTRTGPDPQKSFPCTWQGTGTSPVTAEFYKAGEPGEPSEPGSQALPPDPAQVRHRDGEVLGLGWGGIFMADEAGGRVAGGSGDRGDVLGVAGQDGGIQEDGSPVVPFPRQLACHASDGCRKVRGEITPSAPREAR